MDEQGEDTTQGTDDAQQGTTIPGRVTRPFAVIGTVDPSLLARLSNDARRTDNIVVGPGVLELFEEYPE